jgi:hypothetical protein
LLAPGAYPRNRSAILNARTLTVNRNSRVGHPSKRPRRVSRPLFCVHEDPPFVSPPPLKKILTCMHKHDSGKTIYDCADATLADATMASALILMMNIRGSVQPLRHPLHSRTPDTATAAHKNASTAGLLRCNASADFR